MPSRFKRSYSERCVRRRALGKDNEPAIDIWNANFLVLISQPQKQFRNCDESSRHRYKRSLPPKVSGRLPKERTGNLLRG
jgi:hypothetical protein